MIPISVIMLTKNEALNVPHSLPPIMKNFDDVHIVDSNSTDETAKLAADLGAAVHPFTWNNQYPKKKQLALDNLPIKYEWVLFIDADEIVTDAFIATLKTMNMNADGYFVSAEMVWKGHHLKHGMKNNKLCLFKPAKFHFPVVNDLNIKGGWEVEGHYQPIPSTDDVIIGTIKTPIIHHDRKGTWHRRHDDYVHWEVGMTKYDLWPVDPVHWREMIKDATRASVLRPYLVFMYGYIIKLGFLDGMTGFDYALNRARYTRRIVRAIQQTND